MPAPQDGRRDAAPLAQRPGLAHHPLLRHEFFVVLVGADLASPAYREQGVGPEQAGLLLSLATLVQVVSSLLISALAARSPDRPAVVRRLPCGRRVRLRRHRAVSGGRAGFISQRLCAALFEAHGGCGIASHGASASACRSFAPSRSSTRASSASGTKWRNSATIIRPDEGDVPVGAVFLFSGSLL